MVEPTIAGSRDHDQRKTPPRASDGSFEVPIGLRPLFDRRTSYASDLAVIGLAFGLAYPLRFEFAVPLEHRHTALFSRMIERELADSKSGRVISHEDMGRRIEAWRR